MLARPRRAARPARGRPAGLGAHSHVRLACTPALTPIIIARAHRTCASSTSTRSPRPQRVSAPPSLPLQCVFERRSSKIQLSRGRVPQGPGEAGRGVPPGEPDDPWYVSLRPVVTVPSAQVACADAAAVSSCFDPSEGQEPFSYVFDLTGEILWSRPEEVRAPRG